jgi:dTDP-4-dehydrorhamnose reductase
VSATWTTLVTGAGGQVGRTLCERAPEGVRVLAYPSARLEVTDRAAVQEAVLRDRPAVVIHAAAYTAVDAAEAEAARAEAVNVQGTTHVAEAAKAVGARLIYLSTDFVFDGTSGRPYMPDDPTNPLGVYGRTKRDGEREAQRILGEAALVMRTAWVYSRHGTNFVRTMLALMGERTELGVVADQVGTPTWASSLADAAWVAASRTELHGVLQWTDAGVASWYDFAIAIQEEALALGLLSRAVPVRPLRTEEYPARARRPSYSVLEKQAAWTALGLPPRHWRENLRRMLRELADEPTASASA